MPTKVLALAATACVLFSVTRAKAVEGCQNIQKSCTAMNATCEGICQNRPNPSRCIASTCAQALPTCQSTGTWRVRGGAGCWNTSNRS